jgi:hypothetical protein
MTTPLDKLVHVLKDQSEVIERLSIDHAVERTLIAGLVATLVARDLLAEVDFDAIARIGSTLGNPAFTTSLLRRIELIQRDF